MRQPAECGFLSESPQTPTGNFTFEDVNFLFSVTTYLFSWIKTEITGAVDNVTKVYFEHGLIIYFDSDGALHGKSSPIYSHHKHALIQLPLKYIKVKFNQTALMASVSIYGFG